ncbi:MAG: phosphoribosylamine--glycine ligase [Verrucomicrobiae bacterium]|nr:phosphoribosylamine--glycine ligase [Verrucomicrobiae bacterium]
MNVLVVGGGGREHALVWKLAQSPKVRAIFWSPGNPAAPCDSKVEKLSLPAEDSDGLARFAEARKVDLAVIGPEAPLVAGLANALRAKGLKVFGPERDGARLEGSKVFSKRFFLRHGIPTGRAEMFSDFASALAFARRHPKPLVVKADGLAAGKGVLLCRDDAEAERALGQVMREKAFGDAGREVLVEECLTGPEVSVMAITDGLDFRVLASAQDHKRVFDRDEGPNTGGMGAYSPAPVFTPELEARVRTEVFERTLVGLKVEKIPFCGVLYAGMMLTPNGPKILEYNCRFGDPETQVVLPRLKSDLAEVLLAACEGRLGNVALEWTFEAAVCVVLAAGGYPGAFLKGDPISGLDAAAAKPGACVFHAGTAIRDSRTVTHGGRVLGVTALGPTLREATARAYAAADAIAFDKKHCRRDIAARALAAG